MKIGVIQASSQIEKNTILYECTKDYGEVINFGCFEDEENYSYVEIALEICLLISSQAVDFIVTGCSSGQGMMIACNSLPNLICGYLPTPQDAYLFGRINDGNVASLPLGLNYGWAGEINLKATLQQLFEEPFGIGYPLKDAKRKQEDTKKIKALNQLCKKDIIEFLNEIDLKHIVLETDSPYLAPVPYRGKRNESSYTLLVAQKLAEIYQLPVEEIARITTENSKQIFGI